MLFGNTCSDVIAVAFLRLHLELDFQHHQVVLVGLVSQTFHDFQHTIKYIYSISKTIWMSLKKKKNAEISSSPTVKYEVP